MRPTSTRSKIIISLGSEGLEELRKAVFWDDLAGSNDRRHPDGADVAGAIEGWFWVV